MSGLIHDLVQLLEVRVVMCQAAKEPAKELGKEPTQQPGKAAAAKEPKETVTKPAMPIVPRSTSAGTAVAIPALASAPALPPASSKAITPALRAPNEVVAPAAPLPGSGIEVIAGTYGQVASPAAKPPGAQLPAGPASPASNPEPAGRFAAPEIIAGAYRAPSAVTPSAVTKSAPVAASAKGAAAWQDDLQRRINNGN